MTPLHVAAKGGRVESVRYVVDNGATVDITDEKGVIILYFITNGTADQRLSHSYPQVRVPSFLHNHSQNI